MIVEVRGTSAENVETARREIVALAREWGHEAEVGQEAPRGEGERSDERGVDPVAVASLIVSIPSAALAVADLIERRRSRHRAKDLIDRASELEKQQVVVRVLRPDRPPVEITGLTTDQLLEFADDEPADDDPPA